MSQGQEAGSPCVCGSEKGASETSEGTGEKGRSLDIRGKPLSHASHAAGDLIVLEGG